MPFDFSQSETAVPIIHPPGAGRQLGVLRSRSIFKVESDQTQGAYAILARHDIDPFCYLRDVLTRLPTHPVERLDELLPNRWAAARWAEAEAAAPNTS